MRFRCDKMMTFGIIVLLCSVVEMTTGCRRRCRRRRRVGVLRNILGIPKIITPESTEIINITMTLSITIGNVRGHSGEGKPSGGKSDGSVGVHSEGGGTTFDNAGLHPGEVTPPGGISGDSTGGHAESGDKINVSGTEIPLCRTPSTSNRVSSSGQTTVRSVISPTPLPPITEHYIHWAVEGLLALLLLVLAICLAVKMCNSKTAAVSPGDTQVPSGTTSYEEIGNINISASTDSTQTNSHDQTAAATSGPVVQPEVVIAAGNLYENAREISRPRISSDHTYENLDAIKYEDMRQRQEREADDNYEKLHRGLSSSSRTPESDCSGELYKSLDEGNAGPNATQSSDAKSRQYASHILTHNETTDMDRFADVSDESNGHM